MAWPNEQPNVIEMCSRLWNRPLNLVWWSKANQMYWYIPSIRSLFSTFTEIKQILDTKIIQGEASHLFQISLQMDRASFCYPGSEQT